ncbi:MAG: ribonuclease J [Nitrospirae bacterium]|nr:ribonuclease J [Nitrospirota bacterium]
MQKDAPALSVIPLGGIGEIGLNSTLLEFGDDMMMVDCGLMFPDEEMLGVDIVIPDFSYVLENRDKLRGICITHGHEDHTGALPYLLKELDVPVYGTMLTLGLIQEKLKEHEFGHKVRLVPVKPRDMVELGCFKVEFIRVTHSIVDGVGLGIGTPVGNVIHTGDFKIDPTPVDGELLDFNLFSEYGRRGVLLLMSDSTNATKGGFTFSEKEVRRAFEDIFIKAKKRIIIATFASNIHRIQQAVDVAAMFGRKIILNGRSMVNNARIAADLGYLHIPDGMWMQLEDLKNMKDEDVVIITTGSQGEPMSAMSRMAMDEHKQIKVKKGDTVIISAKIIPGNEKSIARIINHLFMRGADVIYEKTSEIHVSGHASKEELKLMLNIVKPKFFIPVHGEYRHLISHAKLGAKVGIPEENIFVIKDGEVVEFTEDTARRAGFVNAGRVFIDGKGVGDVGDVVLRDRMRLAHDGIVIVILGIEKLTGKLVTGPDIISRGFVFEDASQELLLDVKDVVTEVLFMMPAESKSEWSLVQTKVRSSLKKFIKKRMDRLPMIMPIIIEI